MAQPCRGVPSRLWTPLSRSAAAGLTCADSTRDTICDSVVSLPTRSALTRSMLPELSVPLMTSLPTRFLTGTDSPVPRQRSVGCSRQWVPWWKGGACLDPLQSALPFSQLTLLTKWPSLAVALASLPSKQAKSGRLNGFTRPGHLHSKPCCLTGIVLSRPTHPNANL